MLVDIVSRNGNLLLNFPLPGSGKLDAEELKILDGITAWMAVNSEGIYGTRPWRIYGAGPSTLPRPEKQDRLSFNEVGRKDLTAEDIRFTMKRGIIYAFLMGWPKGAVNIAALGLKSEQQAGKIRHVELLGYRGKLKWMQDTSALKEQMPERRPCDHAVAVKIALA
jgi:alpha-L-fucosidase